MDTARHGRPWPSSAAAWSRTSTSLRTWDTSTCPRGCSSGPTTSSAARRPGGHPLHRQPGRAPLGAGAHGLRDHPLVEIAKGDTWSSRRAPSPATRRACTAPSTGCSRPARTSSTSRRPVHVSGHAAAEELKMMLNLVRPKYFMPCTASIATCTSTPNWRRHRRPRGPRLHHGERRRAGADANGAGIPEVQAGMILVDGMAMGDLQQPPQPWLHCTILSTLTQSKECVMDERPCKSKTLLQKAESPL